MKNRENVPSLRQYDLDWIKVLATLVVFLYHCSMFVNPFPWHLKNNEIDTGAVFVFSLFVGAWIMPLFFMISGISVFHALHKRSVSKYIKERFLRLGVPLVFGIFILTPPQIYIERVTNNQFNGSFLNFIPHYFDGIYLDFGGAGNFAFFGLHLWYLLVLLVFSLITIPLFKKFPIRNKKMGGISFITLPILLFIFGLISTQSIGGWDIVFYLSIFILGYYFLTSESFKPILRSTIKFHFVLAVVTTIIYIGWFMQGYPIAYSIEYLLFFAVKIINCWSWLLCIMYLADRYLTSSNRFLQYGSEASMPFYVLHQPVIILVGFLIYDTSWSIPLKLVFVIVVSFVMIMLCYHFIIRRISILRFLFGMKVQEKREISLLPNKIEV